MEINQQTLREVFDYKDGFLIWKNPPHKKGPQRIGEKAGCKDVLGYWRIGIDRERHYAHRLIWIWHYGTNPKMIDHANCDQADNRIENLRACTKAQNMRNMKRTVANSSGHKGVVWAKHMNKWKAIIGCDGKTYHLGYFDTVETAANAVQAKRVELHKEFANHG
jgi:hypothetical protein